MAEAIYLHLMNFDSTTMAEAYMYIVGRAIIRIADHMKQFEVDHMTDAGKEASVVRLIVRVRRWRRAAKEGEWFAVHKDMSGTPAPGPDDEHDGNLDEMDKILDKTVLESLSSTDDSDTSAEDTGKADVPRSKRAAAAAEQKKKQSRAIAKL